MPIIDADKFRQYLRLCADRQRKKRDDDGIFDNRVHGQYTNVDKVKAVSGILIKG